MNILVTGGAGYIGSHTCVALLEAGHRVIIADNLCNSNLETLNKITKITSKEVIFYQIDVTDESAIDNIFSKHTIDGIIHFASLKAVSESVERPLIYYYNNVISTILLTKACEKHSVKRFVFSSSATVYGKNKVPYVEIMKLLPTTNPYGDFAENVTTRGIDLVNLPIGTRLKAGEILLEVTQIGKKCHGKCAIYELAGDCVMPREGIFSKVIKGGTLSSGDSIEVIE
jgi:nucleoside-diphosphate-sugar epimerase